MSSVPNAQPASKKAKQQEVRQHSCGWRRLIHSPVLIFAAPNPLKLARYTLHTYNVTVQMSGSVSKTNEHFIIMQWRFFSLCHNFCWRLFFVIFLIIEDYLKVCWDYEGTPPKYRKEIRWTNPVFSCMFYKRSTMFFGLKHCLRLWVHIYFYW